MRLPASGAVAVAVRTVFEKTAETIMIDKINPFAGSDSVMARIKRKTRDFADVIRARLAADPELSEAVDDEAFSANIAQQVYDLRNEAALTQTQLAERVETQQSVISRIEDADYDGHSLGMLRRIAVALNRRLRVEFCAQAIPRNSAAPTKSNQHRGSAKQKRGKP